MTVGELILIILTAWRLVTTFIGVRKEGAEGWTFEQSLRLCTWRLLTTIIAIVITITMVAFYVCKSGVLEYKLF